MTTPFQLGYGDYLRFRDLVLQYSGLYFPEKKRQDLEVGLAKALDTVPDGLQTPEAYYRFLNQDNTPAAQAELDRLINLLTIGETHFFRNQAQFDALAHQILPELLRARQMAAQAAHCAPQLRIWSAGCATGEEPYSLAVLLHQLIPDIKDWHIFLLATDINEDALTRARQGIYSEWSFRETRARSMRSIYCTRISEKQYQIREDIRRMVTFTRHNLIEDDFPTIYNNTTTMDLVFCRNVTIYFSEAITAQLVQKFYQSLVDDGWLVVGHSEPSLVTYRDFQTRTFPGAILYQKTGQPTILPANWDLRNPLPSADEARPVPNSTKTAVSSSSSAAHTSTTRKPTAAAPPRRTDLLIPPAADADMYQLACHQLSQGQIDQAILTLEGAQATLPDSQKAAACCLLARAHADKGVWDQARYWCDKTLAQNTLIPEVYAILAMIDEHKGNYEEAIANLKKAIYVDASQPLFHFNLGMLYQKIGQFDQAQRCWKNADKLLAHWEPDQTIPDSGGTTARRLLDTIRHLLAVS